VVVDNNALGNTREEVAKTKARLVVETKQGLGCALMKGFEEATGDLIATIDADGTFKGADIEKLLAYTDEFDVVFGSRTARVTLWSGAFMPLPVRLGNLLWAKAIEVLYNGPLLTDVGCLFRVFSRPALERLKPLFRTSKGGPEFNLELMLFALRQKGLKTIEIPLIFKERVGKSMYVGDSIWKSAKWGLRFIPIIFSRRFERHEH
jgi:glycosyltransferase involved in cell wall biosynthesis